MQTHWALHKCAPNHPPMDSQSGHVELGTGLCQACLVWLRHAQVRALPRWVFSAASALIDLAKAF